MPRPLLYVTDSACVAARLARLLHEWWPPGAGRVCCCGCPVCAPDAPCHCVGYHVATVVVVLGTLPAAGLTVDVVVNVNTIRHTIRGNNALRCSTMRHNTPVCTSQLRPLALCDSYITL